MKHQESTLQINCVKYFRYCYPQYSLNLVAVPNGGYRNRITAAIMKTEGVVAGVADLILFVPNSKWHGLAIEMKNGSKGRQSDYQKQWQAAVESQGYRYLVIRSFDEFREALREYLEKNA